MKTLIINGSPKKNGDTAALINELIRHLDGEVKLISCRDNISPCIDCRFCWKNAGCAVKDDMQAVYEYLTDCDNVVIASPVWYSSLSGITLNIGSRLQMYFAARRFRNETIYRKPKKGLILLVGGNKGTEVQPLETARMLLRLCGAARDEIQAVTSMNTDELPAAKDESALAFVREQAQRLNTPIS